MEFIPSSSSLLFSSILLLTEEVESLCNSTFYEGKLSSVFEAFLAPKMETWPPAHCHSYEEDPQNTGLHTVIEGEDGHEEQLVLKKVKTTANKLKDNDEEEEDGEGIEQDPGVHGAPSGKEAGVTPLISSFEKMGVSDEPGEHILWSSTGSHDQFSPDLPPTETKTIGENTEGNQSQVSEVQEQQNQSSYAEKISSATSTIAEKLAPVYEKVTEAGSAVVSKMQGTGTETEVEPVGGTGKRVSVKEYVVVKLRPSDEDKALSEVISQAFHRRKKVTESPEVVRQLGSDHSEKTPEGSRSKSEAEKGKMGRIKGAVSSWFGKSGEQQHQRTAQASHRSSPVGGVDCQDIPSERKLNESTN